MAAGKRTQKSAAGRRESVSLSLELPQEAPGLSCAALGLTRSGGPLPLGAPDGFAVQLSAAVSPPSDTLSWGPPCCSLAHGHCS